MKPHYQRFLLSPLLALSAAAMSPASAALVFTIEAPGVQQSTVPGVVTENFDDGNLSSTIGTYQAVEKSPRDS